MCFLVLYCKQMYCSNYTTVYSRILFFFFLPPCTLCVLFCSFWWFSRVEVASPMSNLPSFLSGFWDGNGGVIMYRDIGLRTLPNKSPHVAAQWWQEAQTPNHSISSPGHQLKPCRTLSIYIFFTLSSNKYSHTCTSKLCLKKRVNIYSHVLPRHIAGLEALK